MMSSNDNQKVSMNGKGVPPSPTSMSNNNPSILLDKLNVRRSTPDSEALASSDDEGDTQRPVLPPQKPARRASWLNDTSQPTIQPRKNSFASASMSPTASHPSTPSTESNTWASHIPSSSGLASGRATTSSTFPWGVGIWNNEARKEPPARLTEVLPSPTSVHPPGNGHFYSDIHASQTSAIHRDSTANTTIPFAIPLHPTPKTYRSQSYSVGQLDPDMNLPGTNFSGLAPFSGRSSRQNQHPGLQHRPSRPSMLSEVSNDGTGLSKLKEVDDDDDDESLGGSAQGLQQSNEAKTIEYLARENAILRQQHQYNNSRLRSRASTTNAPASAYPAGPVYGLPDSQMETPDYAIDELEEPSDLNDVTNHRLLSRRLSEFGVGGANKIPTYSPVENRKLENVKKAFWQSSLGFGGLEDIPQSRRHSFADVPKRQGSVGSSGGEPLLSQDFDLLAHKELVGRYNDGAGHSYNDHGKHTFSPQPRERIGSLQRDQLFQHEELLRAKYSQQRHAAASYFTGPSSLLRSVEVYEQSTHPTSIYQSQSMGSQYGNARPTSPHHGMYGMAQPRHNQLLYIVLFKCSRADVFYVQEGTGLSINPGDLVIVEADRGTDLGTVAHENVEWSQAKDLKEKYAEEHYKWLMMYSQNASGNQDGTGAGLMAASNGLQGSAVGGMGPPNQHGMQEPNPGELKPKIIKRLAQNHEIQSLRDKEGSEAKAKRVCMQKVKEHGLHMEILDAEFQMDLKKLTFYYFADAYINFNSLVTDLFKVYKTRIWMSAINPASFASPSLGLQAPSGVGPGAVGTTRNTTSERRPQSQEYVAPAPTLNSRPYSGFTSPFTASTDRGSLPPMNFQSGSYTYGIPQFTGPRLSGASYSSGLPQHVDPFLGYTSPSDLHGTPSRFAPPHVHSPDNGEYGHLGTSAQTTEHDAWLSSLQGLSLGSRS